MGNNEKPTVAARITQPLRNLMNEYLSRDAHLGESDFIRDAIREKIKRDAPELYNKMFEGKGTNRQDPTLKRV